MAKTIELRSNAAKMLDVEATFEQIEHNVEHGIPPGLSAGWKQFDQFFTFPPMGQLNVLTGFPGSGKSEFINDIAVNMAKNHNWNTFLYCPENYPSDVHFEDLVGKYIGKPVHPNRHTNNICTKVERAQAKEFFSSHFSSVDCHINNTDIDGVLDSLFNACAVKRTDIAIIDPWNKLETQRPPKMSQGEFIGKVLTRIQMFARQYGIAFFVIAHPTKPSKLRDGSQATLTLHDIADSAHFYNMPDNGFIVSRTRDDRMGASNLNNVSVEKIKNRRYGSPGVMSFDFSPISGRFYPAKTF